MVYSLGIALGIVGKCQDVIAYGHLGEFSTVVDITVVGSTVTAARTHTVGIVGVVPGGAISGHGGELPSMLPGIAPCTVIERIAHTVIGNGCASVGSEQISPTAVTVGIGNRFQKITQSACAVHVFLTLQDDIGIAIS